MWMWRFFKTLDKYDSSLRKSLYVNMKTKRKENITSWKWDDWNYIGDNLKNKK